MAEAALDRVRDKYGPGIVTPLRHVFAAPDDVADVADGLVRRWHTPVGEYGAQWDQALRTRIAIEDFRQMRATWLPGWRWGKVGAAPVRAARPARLR
ncbi:hypothetical protein ACF05F_32115 [Rhodococcus erythropolis]